jgi:hypothetical protein
MNDHTGTDKEHRKAVTRLTSGEAEAVEVIVRMTDGSEEKRSLSVHPYARMIPLITLGDLDRLYDDIRDHGVLEALVVHEGQILDGRNRLAVASVLGVPVQLEEFDGDDAAAKAYVWSANAARRHLTLPQVALAAERFGFVEAAKKEAGPPVPNPDGSARHQGAAPWAIIAAKKVGNITPRTLERFDQARVPEAPDTQRLIDEGKIRRVDIAVKEAVAERTVLTGRMIEVPPPVPRTAWDRLGCARGDVLAAERAVLAGDRGAMTKQQFAERAREIQAALIRIQNIYRYGQS